MGGEQPPLSRGRQGNGPSVGAARQLGPQSPAPLLPTLCDFGQAPQPLWALLFLHKMRGESSREKAPTSPTPGSAEQKAAPQPPCPRVRMRVLLGQAWMAQRAPRPCVRTRVLLGQAWMAQSREKAVRVSPPGQGLPRSPHLFSWWFGQTRTPGLGVIPPPQTPPERWLWAGARGASPSLRPHFTHRAAVPPQRREGRAPSGPSD